MKADATVTLSFCIPTYNRAEYLEEALKSIISQADISIEIVVCDNASTDNTPDIINDAKLLFPGIVYFRWPENMGADANYLKTVELATGDYCWFLGSDDAIEPGAIETIKKELIDENDIYLCSEYFCDKNLKKYATHYLLKEETDSRVFDLTVRGELIEYFSLAQSHSALFGYLSSIIFKRAKWNSVQFDQSYMGTLYSHMFMLYSFIATGCQLKYIKTPLVNWRSGNDSFGGPGKIESRFMIDIDGFIKIMNSFFHDNEDVLAEFQGAFRRHHPIVNIAYLRLHTSSVLRWSDIEMKLVDNYGYEQTLLRWLRLSGTKPVLYLYFIGQRVFRKIVRELAKLRSY